jgi:phosphatidylglycerophosphate synthase
VPTRAPSPPIDELRRVCQPDSILQRRSDEHWAGRLYMRKVSIYLTRVAIRRGVGADAITVGMLVVGLLGAGALFLPGLWPAVVAAVAVQAYVLLDCSDGEVARWTRTESARGVYLDRVSHYLVEAALLVGLGWRAGGGGASPWLSVGLVAALAVVLGRAETDLVAAARAQSGLGPSETDGSGLRQPILRRLRRAADFLPIHRITGAVEASLLIAGAAVADHVRGDLTVSRWLVAAMAIVGVAVAAGHLVSVLSSDRLA